VIHEDEASDDDDDDDDDDDEEDDNDDDDDDDAVDQEDSANDNDYDDEDVAREEDTEDDANLENGNKSSSAKLGLKAKATNKVKSGLKSLQQRSSAAGQQQQDEPIVNSSLFDEDYDDDDDDEDLDYYNEEDSMNVIDQVDESGDNLGSCRGDLDEECYNGEQKALKGKAHQKRTLKHILSKITTHHHHVPKDCKYF
jgi:hypothetical protein